MRNLHAKLFLNRLLDFEQTWVTKFHHAFGVEVDKVVVLAELVGAFVLCTVVPKLVLDDQAAIQQQLDGVVKRGAADAIFVVLHLVIERVDVEVPICRIDFLEDGKTLGGLA